MYNMPIRRRNNRRKPRYRRRRRKARKPTLSRQLALTGMNGTHIVRQKTFTPLQIGSLGIPEFHEIAFSLAQIPQLAAFQRVYDRYCIYSTTTQIIMNDNQPPTGNQSFSAAYSIDLDSVPAIPATWNSFIERGNVKMKTMTTGYKGASSLYFKQRPRPLTELYKTALQSGYMIMPASKPVWIDMRDPGYRSFA